MAAIRGPFGASQTELSALLDEARLTNRLLQKILDEQEERFEEQEAARRVQEQALGELCRIRQALERRSRPRDEDDIRVLMALVDVVGPRRFSAAEVMAHALVAPALRDALAAADCDNPISLGRLLGRVEGREINGVMLLRVGEDRQGVVWKLRFCVSTPEAA